MEVRRQLLLLLVLLCFGMATRASNIVTVSTTEGTPGEEVTVSIGLTNTDAVSGLQVSIPLDESLTLVEGSGQQGSRCSGHSLTVGVKDGVLNVLIYSLSLSAISGNSGEVATFRLKLGNQPQTISLTPSMTKLTDGSGNTLESTATGGSVTTRCAKAQYSTMEVDFGEVPIRSTYEKTVTVTNVGNADLTVTDLVFSDVNVFSTTTAFPFTVAPGASRQVNITYAPVERGSISRTLKVECNSTSKLNTIKLMAQPFAVNELHVQPASGISDEEVTVTMTMNNMDDISGYQVEFTLPDQLEYVDGSFVLSDRKQDHVSMATLNGSTLRIIVYSPSDKPLTGHDGDIGSFRVKLVGRNSTTLTPTKAVLSATINNKVENVLSEMYGGQITIRSPRISTASTLDFGAVSVTEACEKTFAIRNNGAAPLTVSRIVFNNENLSVKESLPLTVAANSSQNITVVYSSTEQTSFSATMQIYNNDPDLRLREVTVTGSRFAPNFLSVGTQDIYPYEDLNIDVALNNYDAASGLQFDVIYPGTYFTVPDNNFTLTDRAQGMTVTSRRMDANTLRYFCYFLTGNGITAGEGSIMSIKLTPVNENVPTGSYTVSLKNVIFGTGEMTDKYAGTDVQKNFNVKADVITITGKNYSRIYGEDNPSFEFTTEGAPLRGEPVISCEATATSPAGEYPIVITQGSVINGSVTYVNGKLTIEKAPLTISGGTYTMKQGEELPAFAASYDGFKNEETEDVLTTKPTLTTTATSASEPGDYEVTVSGAEAQNYEITYVPGTLTVGAADAVTVTATSYTIKYGDAIPEFAFTSEGATLDGTPSITCEATATSPVGEYAIVITKGSVTNYNDHYVNGKLTIEKAPLTISGGTYTMKQGEELPAFVASYDGFKNEETEEVLTTKPTLTTTATSASEPGEYAVTVSGAEAQNYDISYVPGTLTIGAADAVTVTATSYTIKYGDAIPEFAFTSEGATLDGTPSITCEATATSPVGEYAIVITKGSVTNYNDHYVNGKLTIEKAPLTISGGTYTMKQGEELPTFTATYDGFKNEETEDVLTTKPTLSTEATSASEPGEYEVTVAGAEAQNYAISYVPGMLTIGAADPVTVTATSYTIKYGDAIPEFAFTSEGATLDGTPGITCEATATSPVGEYAIVITKGSVTNYNDHYVNGKLTIEKAPLTISGGTYTMKQGEELPAFVASYDGFKNEETEEVLTTKPTLTTTATSASEPGEYAVTVSGAEAQNYAISYVPGTLTIGAADAVTVTATSYTIKYGDAIPEFAFTSEGATLDGTPSITCEATATSPVGEYAIVITKGSVTNYNDHYVNGTLTIEKAPLTISGGTYTMKQGEELPTFTATYDGFKNEETEDVLTTKPTLTTTATSASEPGEYSVTVSGAEAQNYAISYVPGTLTIGAADPVTVTATSYTIKYGDAIPEFAFTSEGASLDGTPSITCEATATSPVGEYAIVITKGSVTNYNDHYVNGTLTIEKAPLTISGGTYTMKQGEELPAFVASYDGFKNEETEEVLTTKPTLSTTATSASEPGDYEVTVSGAEAQNYAISYVPGTLTIEEPDVLLGDVNNDGKVNIGDVVAVVNVMAGKTTGYNLKAADANQDGKINIGDVVKIVNIIAGKV